MSGSPAVIELGISSGRRDGPCSRPALRAAELQPPPAIFGIAFDGILFATARHKHNSRCEMATDV
jgi:hypothetical protein